MCSSAAEAHLLPGSTYCALRYNILHTLVVTSNYLSYCCLSIISNHSAGYLCYQAIEQVYLLKWPVSIYIYIYIYIYTYSGYGKYSDPLTFFTLCYIAAIC